MNKPNRHGIQARVLLLAILPLLLVVSALTWYSIQARQSDIEQAMEDRALAAVQELAQACEYGLFSGEHDALLRQASLSLASSGATAVRIVDRNGSELLHLGQPQFKPDWRLGQTQVLGRDDQRLLVAAPVQQVSQNDDPGLASGNANPPLGYVSLEIPRHEAMMRKRHVMFVSLGFTALGLALAGLLAWGLGRDIVRPIRQLTRAVVKIGNGDLDARVKVGAGGEFMALEQGINRMAVELQASYGNLEEKIRAATAELAWRADHDPLTGLLNRAGFEVELSIALEQARSGRCHALLYLDLDRFKEVNDRGGHLAGDELLCLLTSLVQSWLRVEDTFARLGGDEFSILLVDCDPDRTLERAWGLCRGIGEQRFHCAGQDYQVGASIGLVSLDQDWVDSSKLMSAADGACYAAKNGGRDRVSVYPH